MADIVAQVLETAQREEAARAAAAPPVVVPVANAAEVLENVMTTSGDVVSAVMSAFTTTSAVGSAVPAPEIEDYVEEDEEDEDQGDPNERPRARRRTFDPMSVNPSVHTGASGTERAAAAEKLKSAAERLKTR